MEYSLFKNAIFGIGVLVAALLSSCNTSSPDTTKFDAAYELSKESIDSIELSIIHCKNAIEEAKESKSAKLLAKGYWRLGYLYDVSDDLSSAMNYYTNAADIYVHLNDFESANKLFENVGTKALESHAGQVALNRYTERLKYALKLDDLAKANAYYDIGLAYKSIKMLDSAHFYQLKVLDYEATDSVLRSDALNELGLIQFHIDNYDSARLYYNQSLELDPSPSKSYKTTNNIANAYLEDGNLLKAKVWFRMALHLGSNELKSKRAIVKPLNGIGKIFYRMEETDSALTYFKKSVEANRVAQGVAGNISNFDNRFFRSTSRDLSVPYEYINELDSDYASELASSYMMGHFSDFIQSINDLTQSDAKRSIQLIDSDRDRAKLIALLKSYEEAKTKHIIYISVLLLLTILGIFLGIRRFWKSAQIKKEIDKEVDRLNLTI